MEIFLFFGNIFIFWKYFYVLEIFLFFGNIVIVFPRCSEFAHVSADDGVSLLGTAGEGREVRDRLASSRAADRQQQVDSSGAVLQGLGHAVCDLTLQTRQVDRGPATRAHRCKHNAGRVSDKRVNS